MGLSALHGLQVLVRKADGPERLIGVFSDLLRNQLLHLFRESLHRPLFVYVAAA